MSKNSTRLAISAEYSTANYWFEPKRDHNLIPIICVIGIFFVLYFPILNMDTHQWINTPYHILVYLWEKYRDLFLSQKLLKSNLIQTKNAFFRLFFGGIIVF